MTTIVITGASGLLGANMVMHAVDCSLPVFAISNSNSTCFSQAKNRSIDLTNFSAVKEFLTSIYPSHIIHCASLTNVDYCEQQPEQAALINTESAGNLAKIAYDLGAKFVYISTDSVFDGKQGHYSEEDQVNPVNEYARTKYHGENAVLASHPDSIIVRTNMYGWNLQNKHSLSEWMLHQLKNNHPFNGFDDVILSPLLVNDLSQIVLKLMDTSFSGVINAGSADSCSKYEFGIKLCERFGYDKHVITPISIDSIPMNANRPKNTSLNTSKISTLLNKEMPTIAEGLERFMQLRDTGFVVSLKSFGGAVTS